MLQGLERADGHAELFAHLEVLKGALEGFEAIAQHLGSQTNTRAVQYRLQDRKPVVKGAEEGVRAHNHII